MKRTKLLNKILFLFVAVVLSLNFLSVLSPTSNSHAQDNQLTIDSSKFIYEPSHTTYFEDHIFFIDNYNEKYYFKSYNVGLSGASYAELSQELDFDVCDAFSANNLFFILTEDSVKFIDLSSETLTIHDLSGEILAKNAYSSLFVYNYEKEFIITLTPTDMTKANALIFRFNETENTLSRHEIGNDSKKDSNVSMIATIKINQTDYCYLYFGESKLQYRELPETMLSSNFISVSNSPIEITNSNLDSNSMTEVMGVNMISINQENLDKEYFLITYKKQISEGIEYYNKIYSYDFSQEHNFTFNSANLSEGIQTIYSSSKYLHTYKNYIIYPSLMQNPQIIYSEITPTLIHQNYITNPTPTIDEFDKNDYIIKQTNKPAYLLQNPWDLTSDIEIPSNIDVIIVGTPLISNTSIDNLYYCLYTSINSDTTYQNNYGFIKSENLDDKNEVSLSDLNLANIVKVLPNTSVYELPSKASNIKLEADGKFAVEIIDTMKSYKTGSIEWIKVKIGNTTGYIDRNRIKFTSEKVDFITTNATIIKDNTYVYSEANSNSELIYNKPLNSGKNVCIEGIRDTKTGYTKIRFNDDYGNEFEGYIKTENLKADNWSQLQIIGSILIAINTGILILILVFKNKKLSKPNSSYIIHDDENETLN